MDRWHTLCVQGQVISVRVCRRGTGWTAHTTDPQTAAVGADEQEALVNLADLLVLSAASPTRTVPNATPSTGRAPEAGTGQTPAVSEAGTGHAGR